MFSNEKDKEDHQVEESTDIHLLDFYLIQLHVLQGSSNLGQ